MEDVELIDGDEVEEALACIVQKVLLTPKQEEPTQKLTIFKTRCIVNKKVCDVLIDSGSTKTLYLRHW